MRSSSGNSHGKGNVLRAVLAASVLVGAAAHASEHSFVLTAYTNAKGGRDLVKGDYVAAGKALEHRSVLSSVDGSTISNNRCVALAISKRWDEARAACDKAVRDAEREKFELPTYEYWARGMHNDYIAIALSNRAVFHWMSSESDAAAADLERAEQLSPKAAFVAQNRSALEHSYATTARVDVAAK